MSTPATEATTPKFVYLVDASIYVYRGWQTIPSSVKNIHGQSFNAVTSFTEMMVSIIESESPNHFMVAFDTRNKQAIRYRLYPDYKANRSQSPTELQDQFVQCQAVCKALGIAAMSHPDIEADDIIGHLANLAQEQQQPACIVSADKDLVQFITEDDIFWDYARKTRASYKQLQKRFGVKPSQWADVLALCGDKTDNIPGVPGVGVATAARVLTKWETMDAVFDNLDGVASMRFKGAAQVATLLGEHEATVRLARQLTGLVRVPELPSSLQCAAFTAPELTHCTSQLEAVGFTHTEALSYAKRVRSRCAVQEQHQQ